MQGCMEKIRKGEGNVGSDLIFVLGGYLKSLKSFFLMHVIGEIRQNVIFSWGGGVITLKKALEYLLHFFLLPALLLLT